MNSRILPVLICLALLSAITTLKAEIDWKAWYDERTKDYEAALLLPDQEKIPILGQMLRPADPLGLVPKNSFQQDHYLRAQSTLLSLPGHAEYFGKKITGAHQRYKNNESVAGENAMAKYQQELLYSLAPLQNLPSPETVRVVGEMLSDNWAQEGWDKARDPSSAPPGPLCNRAAFVLNMLPINDKPYPFHGKYISGSGVRESLPLWQKWYQQVKEGRRTFSFEGDSNEYDLNGIVSEAKNPDIPRTSKRPNISAETEARSTPSSRTPWMTAVIVAFAILVGLYLFRRKTT